MKPLVGLFFYFIFTQAHAGTSVQLRSELQKSKETWEAWRDTNNNSYVFTDIDVSVFGGRSISAIYVQKGQFQQLKNCSYDNDESAAKRTIKTKIDFSNDKVPLTIDGIYKFCESEVLTRVDQGIDSPRILFSKNGLLKECSFHPDLCEDDCRNGYVISALEHTQSSEKFARGICPDNISVYFDKGLYSLSNRAKDELKKVAKSFSAGFMKLQIEGHTDQQGSIYRNLELGQKRAFAVKSYLVRQGIDEKQITVISYGKEKPIEFGKGEEAFAKNRRAKILPIFE